MSNPTQEYNDYIRANLPLGITYDEVRARYVTVNGKYFPTYLEAKWYLDYITKFGFSAFGLLDFYPGAAAAYSLRKLSKNTTNVVRVRRSSDNAEQDFTAKQITDGTLVGFCGTGDGLVTTWYDQSGNGNDATKITASEQPKIVDAGVLVTENGKPALDFDGVDDDLLSKNFSAIGVSNHYILCVVYFNTFTPENSMQVFGFDESSGTNFLSLGYNSNVTPVAAKLFSKKETPGEGGALTENAITIISELWDGNQFEIFLNKENIYNVTPLGTNWSQSDTLSIGQADNTNTKCGVSEAIYYPSDQSTNREAIEQNIASHYGITLA